MALGVTALPHFIFISSPNPNYWFHSRSMTLPKMEDLIHRYVTPNVTKITSSSQTTDFIKRVRKGGSVFQLTVPEEGHPLIQQFTDISIKYLGLYCTFIYDINPEVTSPTLTVYRSTECSLSFSISDESQLEQIIEQYRFSHYRSLNWYEWNRFFLQSPSIVFLNNRNTVEKSGAHDLFKNISKEYCNKMEIGINDVGKEVTILTNTHQPAIEETNVLYAYPKKQCSLMKSYKEGFEGIKAMIEGAENDEKCMKFESNTFPMKEETNQEL
ncbi:hypothetical protein GPJ56_002579 [Histomonas meleagridis]|uniref:uncharacterized protein n=1 Tax=Histomonas meleagridis TaxID=135588 RepID=UPI003559588D|nr:hypothetical protein GPJ56_002579 [Histomonas meleagridis]KAH0801371.1 hypothetical protein GO595_005966 [Histomonas meleagridis]